MPYLWRAGSPIFVLATHLVREHAAGKPAAEKAPLSSGISKPTTAETAKSNPDKNDRPSSKATSRESDPCSKPAKAEVVVAGIRVPASLLVWCTAESVFGTGFGSLLPNVACPSANSGPKPSLRIGGLASRLAEADWRSPARSRVELRHETRGQTTTNTGHFNQ